MLYPPPPQVCLQHHPEGGDADHHQSGAGVSFPAAGRPAHCISICGIAPPCMYFFFSSIPIMEGVRGMKMWLFTFVTSAAKEMGPSIQELREASTGPSRLSISFWGTLPGAGEPLGCHGQGQDHDSKSPHPFFSYVNPPFHLLKQWPQPLTQFQCCSAIFLLLLALPSSDQTSVLLSAPIMWLESLHLNGFLLFTVFFPSRFWWTCISWRSWRRRWSCAGSPSELPLTKASSSARTRGYVVHLVLSVV